MGEKWRNFSVFVRVKFGILPDSEKAIKKKILRKKDQNKKWSQFRDQCSFIINAI